MVITNLYQKKQRNRANGMPIAYFDKFGVRQNFPSGLTQVRVLRMRTETLRHRGSVPLPNPPACTRLGVMADKFVFQGF